MMINESYVKEILKNLLEIPSPSGFYHDIMAYINSEVNKLGYTFETTNKGCGVITIPGQEEGYIVGLSAHVDTLGAMVRSINGSGTLRLTSVGGYMGQTIEGEYCKVHTRDGKVYDGTILTTQPSVHVYSDARKQERTLENYEIRLDEDVDSDESVRELGIEVGDYVSFDPRARFFDNGFIKSRHLDDKAGVAALFGFMEHLNTNNLQPRHTVKIFISVYEEMGHGSSFIPQDIDELIAVDMGAMGDDLQCTEKQVSICAKDSSGPYDYDIVNRLVALSKEKEINYVVDIYPFYGSDVSAALRGGNDIKGGLIGPGVHASHSMERTHINAILDTTKLLVYYTA
ncbi:M42 family metallopeptidase [Vallitalea okinawensis]|uniref:M42 family metallopeptidase n=1 Tax=Vallitalea okinawensis TaxID=2078660 RepID=UPI000CFAFF32|nr:M42 family metallopeptidase [Vallitalea okinawensis]